MTRRFTEKLAEIVWDELDQQTEKRLAEIIAECESLTTTNCGWVAYWLKDVVITIAKNILKLRQEAAEEMCEQAARHLSERRN